jgi:uncharacterized protein YebE (UPF0316 family)
MTLFAQLSDNTLFTWVILPILIFCLRICDVSFGTLRIIFVSRSKRFIAPILGFFEASIWVLAINQVMQNLNNIACFLAYSLGFAAGNFIGILIEDKLAIGTLIIRVFLVNDNTAMRARLQDAGFGGTSIDAHGKTGDVKILYLVIKRKSLPDAINIIEACQSNAIYSIEEAKAVKQGIFPADKKHGFSSIKHHYRKPGK